MVDCWFCRCFESFWTITFSENSCWEFKEQAVAGAVAVGAAVAAVSVVVVVIAVVVVKGNFRSNLGLPGAECVSVLRWVDWLDRLEKKNNDKKGLMCF